MPLGNYTLHEQPAELQNPLNINLNRNRNANPAPLPGVETEEERTVRLQAEARRQAREHRENRIRAVRRNCRILMPETVFNRRSVSVQGEVYAERSIESIGAGKRKTRQGWKRSALYQKEANARLVENGVEAFEAGLAERFREHALLESEHLKSQAPGVVLFLTGEQEKDEELMQQVFAQRQEDAARICMERFMETNLNFDLRTDRSFGEASSELEGVSRKTREIKRLLERFPQLRENLTEDRKVDLDAKLEVAEDLSNYYEIRKKIITNARYRSHYNSEISYRYHESDTLEAKNLTMLLWQAERLKNNVSLSPAAELLERLDQMNPRVQTQAETQQQPQRRAARLTREDAISSYSDQRSMSSRRQLASLSQWMRRYLLNGPADAVDAYVEGTRYAVGYTEERERLKKAMNAVDEALRTRDNVALRHAKDYFERMTNGSLTIPEDAPRLNFAGEKPKEAGRVRGGAHRTEVLRAFTHWSAQEDTPLFSHEPTVNDLKQRFVSNCYMVAATAGLVNVNPYLLKSCLKDNGDGTVTVRLYRRVARNRPQEEPNPADIPADGEELEGFEVDDAFAVEHVLEPVYVTVSKEIPRIGSADALSSGALWMQMIEKACAFLGRDGATGYRSLWYGEGGEFLERLLGVSPVNVAEEDRNDELFENMLHARERNIVYNAGSKNNVDESDGLNAGHAYTVMGTEQIAGERYVKLRNPYSTMSLQEEEGNVTRTGRMFDTSSDETYGQFYMKFEDFIQKFEKITYTDLSHV